MFRTAVRSIRAAVEGRRQKEATTTRPSAPGNLIFLAKSFRPMAVYQISLMDVALCRGVALDDCGTDAHYWAPPAQNRTCDIVE